MVDLAEHDKLGVGKRSSKPVAGASEIEVADGDKCRACDRGQLGLSEWTHRRPTHNGRKRLFIVAGLVGVLGKETGDVVIWVGRAIERGQDALRARVVRAKYVLTNASENQTIEPVWFKTCQTQQRERAERESDRVHWFVWEYIGDTCGEVGVCRGVMWLGRFAVAE